MLSSCTYKIRSVDTYREKVPKHQIYGKGTFSCVKIIIIIERNSQLQADLEFCTVSRAVRKIFKFRPR